MFSIESLTPDGQAIAVETIAYRALMAAAQKAASAIARENSNANQSIDGANDDVSDADADATHDETTEEQGNAPPVTFIEYCRLADAANDHARTLSGGGTFARVQNLDYIVDRMCTARPGRLPPDAIEMTKAIVKAHSGADLSDDDARVLAQAEANAREAYFAERNKGMRDDILLRVRNGVEEAMRQDRSGEGPVDCDLDVLIANLPSNVRFVLLGAIERAIDFKCDELLTGLRFGKPSAVSKIPMLARAGIIAPLRADQKLVAAAKKLLAHADPELIEA
jgi:hypothetical protein